MLNLLWITTAWSDLLTLFGSRRLAVAYLPDLNRDGLKFVTYLDWFTTAWRRLLIWIGSQRLEVTYLPLSDRDGLKWHTWLILIATAWDGLFTWFWSWRLEVTYLPDSNYDGFIACRCTVTVTFLVFQKVICKKTSIRISVYWEFLKSIPILSLIYCLFGICLQLYVFLVNGQRSVQDGFVTLAKIYNNNYCLRAANKIARTDWNISAQLLLGDAKNVLHLISHLCPCSVISVLSF